MKRLFVLLVLCSGCTALMSQTPQTRSVTLPLAPPAAYQQATTAMARMGGAITQSDAQQGLLSATVHNAVTLTVLVRPDGDGSRVEVTGTLLPNKIVVGTFDEVDHYIALLH